MSENEDADPVGPPDPLTVYTELAIMAGLMKSGESIDVRLAKFAAELVGRCADIADAVGEQVKGAYVGEEIRDQLGRIKLT